METNLQPPKTVQNLSNAPMWTVTRLTPRGRGGIGTLLLEGKGAEKAFCPFFTLADGSLCSPEILRKYQNAPLFGRFALTGGVKEEAVVYAVSPEKLEIHSHGGETVRSAILRALTSAGGKEVFSPLPCWEDGVHSAAPPDFKKDALRLLPFARTDRTARIILDQVNGAAGSFFTDYPSAVLRAKRVEELEPVGRALYTPPQVLLIGPVNAGKSSLLNALLGFDRAIVDPSEGTTRDAISAETVLDGFPVIFCDTAGLRGQAGRLEREGIARIEPLLASAQLVLILFDITAPGIDPLADFAEELRRAGIPTPPWTTPARSLLVLNKRDLPAKTRNPFWTQQKHEDGSILEISLFQPETIQELQSRIVRRLFPVIPGQGDFVPLNEGERRYAVSF